MARRRRGRIKRGAAIAALIGSTLTMSVAQAHAAAGALDATFSDDGKALLPVTGEPTDLVTQPDGKVLITNAEGFTVARLTADGSPDNAFGGDGIVGVDFGQKSGGANSAALQPDGKIVVAGTVEVPAGGYRIAVARLTQSGALDPTFDPGGPEGDGKKLYDNLAPYSAEAVLIQADNKIVIAGTGQLGFQLARLHPTGEVDSTQWDYAHFDDYGTVYDAALAPDGKIVVAGYQQPQSGTDYDVAVARFNPSGTIDKTFAGTGQATYGPDDRSETATNVLVQPDGKIVLAGAPAAVRR
jgi:uncharacterized delta-60 repeat protein